MFNGGEIQNAQELISNIAFEEAQEDRLLQNMLPTKDNLLRRRALSMDQAHCVSGCTENHNA
ncbi:hypothetical protein TSUD_100980 [Trifolium subterraneum]|uniref:Uncharacterized protein n=1 Tax=Trifolium subterraneum TaxID=3900 RepID=A0A2Z6NF95_TRISU|nr:hypothetical protein TSUD_100980 [Trifolium subterraneum]